nr:hypothetical protein Iba_chr06dCG2250 [Ipomoea batatas]
MDGWMAAPISSFFLDKSFFFSRQGPSLHAPSHLFILFVYYSQPSSPFWEQHKIKEGFTTHKDKEPVGVMEGGTQIKKHACFQSME